MTRAIANDVFLEAMRTLKVTEWRARTIHRAVRCFGWVAWGKKRATG